MGKKMTGYVFLDGEIIPFKDAKVSVFDRGLLYGDGLFETIRVENGYPLFFRAHLERLYNSCMFLNISLERRPADAWNLIIEKLLTRNNLNHGLAVVKILVTRGSKDLNLGLPKSSSPTTIIYARSYTPLSGQMYSKGLHAEMYPFPRHSILADHKTLNYLFYLTAREWAKKKGADEGIVMNDDGTISEGTTSNIFYRKKDIVYTPTSLHYLMGIMEKQVMTVLENQGVKIEKIPTTPKMLTDADEVFLTNSLITVIPVRKIGGHKFLAEKPMSIMLREVNWANMSRTNE